MLPCSQLCGQTCWHRGLTGAGARSGLRESSGTGVRVALTGLHKSSGTGWSQDCPLCGMSKSSCVAGLHLSSRTGGPTIGTIGRWGSAHQVRIFSHNRQYTCCSCVLTPSGFDEIRVGRTVKRRSLGRFLAMQEFKLTTLLILILFLSLSNSQCESLQRNSVI